VVVDDGVDDVVAEPASLLLAGAGAIAGDGVARLSEPGQRCPVDMQQITGTRPLIPVCRLALLRRRP
jgi:hypothetical protein